MSMDTRKWKIVTTYAGFKSTLEADNTDELLAYLKFMVDKDPHRWIDTVVTLQPMNDWNRCVHEKR
jgi:hypothetical protein